MKIFNVEYLSLKSHTTWVIVEVNSYNIISNFSKKMSQGNIINKI